MLRTVLLASLLALAALPLAPTAHAAVGESCTVSLYTWAAAATCTGLFYEQAVLTWCPNHPTVDCFNLHLVTCTVSTQRPHLWCPPFAALA